MKNDDVLVKQSNIHGTGVFAKRDFSSGEVVLQWDISTVLSEAQFNKMTETEKRYVSFLNNTYVLMQEPERFVNHSCKPNTIAKGFSDIAIRDIKKEKKLPEITEKNYLQIRL